MGKDSGRAILLQGPHRHLRGPMLSGSFSYLLKIVFQYHFHYELRKGRKEGKKGEMKRQRGGRDFVVLGRKGMGF